MKTRKDRQIEIVRELVKEPHVILNEMTKHKCKILHPTLGIVGEVLELFKAIRNDDRDNIVEEAGDLLFYLTDLRIVFGVENEVSSYLLEEEDSNIDEALRILEETTEKILDRVKKFVVYNKPIEDVKIVFYIEVIESCLDKILEEENIDEDEVRQYNIDKLKDGPLARYGEGYSDDAARRRKDKD